MMGDLRRTISALGCIKTESVDDRHDLLTFISEFTYPNNEGLFLYLREIILESV